MIQKIWQIGMKISFWYYEWYSFTVIKLGRKFLNRIQFNYSRSLLRLLPTKVRYLAYKCNQRGHLIGERCQNEIHMFKLQSFNLYNQINIIQSRLDLIFTDGLLIDNLQKKLYNAWAKKFLIFSVLFFNDRWFFEQISKTVTNQLLWPIRDFFYVDGFSIFSAVQPIIFGFFSVFVILNLLVIFIVLL